MGQGQLEMKPPGSCRGRSGLGPVCPAGVPRRDVRWKGSWGVPGGGHGGGQWASPGVAASCVSGANKCSPRRRHRQLKGELGNVLTGGSHTRHRDATGRAPLSRGQASPREGCRSLTPRGSASTRRSYREDALWSDSWCFKVPTRSAPGWTTPTTPTLRCRPRAALFTGCWWGLTARLTRVLVRRARHTVTAGALASPPPRARWRNRTIVACEALWGPPRSHPRQSHPWAPVRVSFSCCPSVFYRVPAART